MEVRHRDGGEYSKWFARLGPRAKATVAAEIELLAVRWPIDMPRVRSLGTGLYELRIVTHSLRLFFTVTGSVVTFVAYRRNDTHDRDVERARRRLT